MLHVLRLTYTRSEADAAPFIPGHVAYLERHHASGVFLASGQTVPTTDGGAIIARGVDRETVEAITAEDPFVTSGVGAYTITTIAPGRLHSALAPLV